MKEKDLSDGNGPQSGVAPSTVSLATPVVLNNLGSEQGYVLA
jgi:hypothetical protein